jgi:hypothetical protein
LPALKHFHSDREWHEVLLFTVSICALHDAGVEVAVLVKLAAGYGVEDLGARAAMVGEDFRSALWNHPGLVLHVLAAAGNEE